MADKNRKRIILVGGGTLGSVSPLLAIARKYPADYLFVGTENGPEKHYLSSHGFDNFLAIKSGKLRRYFSWQNFWDIFRLILAFFQSLKILLKFKADLVLTAGSFVAVPVAWAAWLYRVPIVAHQQDVEIGLANKLIAPLAKKITVVFSEQEQYFSRKKVLLTGNPIRDLDFKQAKDFAPCVLITGGGIGARGLNDFMAPFIPRLLEKYQVYHFLGEKNFDQRLDLDGYHPIKFSAQEIIEIMARADIIISRAGMSLISEASALRKALVLVPMSASHQERNAAFLAKHNAAFMVRQGNYQIMDRYLDKLMSNDDLRRALGQNLYQLFPQNAVNDYKILMDKLLKK
ncbi:MAG: UDP-N-acetylglucosamine--N-acetylmuramyl-(pentapeptide) pyrophosphoryl-undecaprenol N-acetylglucosamine transferase [Patescibacteria group bacterium]|nr:UDP-N-acetylglucosamine--N-acetylmuramyl-(pentapeptide) pyrophosphoryl-undecaprenol N-acetylglucosamine transferase [Patescibacteria group bacterium]